MRVDSTIILFLNPAGQWRIPEARRKMHRCDEPLFNVEMTTCFTGVVGQKSLSYRLVRLFG